MAGICPIGMFIKDFVPNVHVILFWTSQCITATSGWLDESAHDRKVWLQSLNIHRPIMIHFQSSALFQRLHFQTETSSLPRKLSICSNNTLDIYQKFSSWGFKDEPQQHNGLPQISLTSLDNREDCNRVPACSGSYTKCLNLWQDWSSF